MVRSKVGFLNSPLLHFSIVIVQVCNRKLAFSLMPAQPQQHQSFNCNDAAEFRKQKRRTGTRIPFSGDEKEVGDAPLFVGKINHHFIKKNLDLGLEKESGKASLFSPHFLTERGGGCLRLRANDIPIKKPLENVVVYS